MDKMKMVDVVAWEQQCYVDGYAIYANGRRFYVRPIYEPCTGWDRFVWFFIKLRWALVRRFLGD